jgi:hypothetical protein
MMPAPAAIIAAARPARRPASPAPVWASWDGEPPVTVALLLVWAVLAGPEVEVLEAVVEGVVVPVPVVEGVT